MSETHRCHATYCNRPVNPRMWGCRKHWFMVPTYLRDKIWLHYRPGQEDDKRPSKAYCLAARAAVRSVARQEHHRPQTQLYDAFLDELENEHDTKIAQARLAEVAMMPEKILRGAKLAKRLKKLLQ